MAPARPSPAPGRVAQGPVRDGAQSTVSGAIGNAVSTSIIASNPELVPFAWMLGAGITGVLGGLGNWSRTRGGLPKAFFGWIG